jgi:hypothetical protein
MKDEGLMETKEETCKERKRLQHIFYFISFSSQLVLLAEA